MVILIVSVGLVALFIGAVVGETIGMKRAEKFNQFNDGLGEISGRLHVLEQYIDKLWKIRSEHLTTSKKAKRK